MGKTLYKCWQATKRWWPEEGAWPLVGTNDWDLSRAGLYPRVWSSLGLLYDTILSASNCSFQVCFSGCTSVLLEYSVATKNAVSLARDVFLLFQVPKHGSTPTVLEIISPLEAWRRATIRKLAGKAEFASISTHGRHLFLQYLMLLPSCWF